MNQQEYEVLFDNAEVTLEMQVVYLVFRRYVDFSTGVVGLKRIVDYNEIRQTLEWRPERGSNRPPRTYSSGQIKRIIQSLVELGVFVRMHTSGLRERMVFRLPLIRTASVYSDEARHQRGTSGATQQKPDMAGAVEAKSDTGATKEARHISIVSINNSLSCAGGEKKFPMFPHWDVFNQDGFAEQCALSDVCWDLMGLEQRERCRVEFVRYEMTEGRMATQEAWEHRFINTLVRQAEWGRVPSNGLAGRQSSYQ